MSVYYYFGCDQCRVRIPLCNHHGCLLRPWADDPYNIMGFIYAHKLHGITVFDEFDKRVEGLESEQYACPFEDEPDERIDPLNAMPLVEASETFVEAREDGRTRIECYGVGINLSVEEATALRRWLDHWSDRFATDLPWGKANALSDRAKKR